MKKPIIYFILLIAFSGCATLTQTQINSVDQFARSSKDFSAFPSKIINECASIRKDAAIFYANSIVDPGEHIKQLDSIYADYKRDMQISSKIDITFKIIDKYAQSLALLSSEKFASDLDIQAKNFGVDIDSLITLYNQASTTNKLPSGIGKAVSQLIVLGGKQYIRSKQAKELKRFIPEGDVLIATMSKELLGYLGSFGIDTMISNVGMDIPECYKMYLTFYKRINRPPPIENEIEYLRLKENFDNVKKLRQHTIDALRSLRLAHKKLLETISEKKTIKENISELQTFYEDINALKNIIQNINNNKK